jgi:hypothetical protein
MHRRVEHQRRASVDYLWAFAALTASPGDQARYDCCRATGDRHIAAQHNLFNRMIGILRHCLETRTRHKENSTFPTTDTTTPAAAA